MRRFDILLIEDNTADVALTISAFRDALVDAQVHVAEDVEKAMAFLQAVECAIRPDLVILDLGLPMGDGFEVLEAMKADLELRTIPVIVLTGSEREEDQTRAYRLQIAAYIVKPPDKDKYFAAIRSIKELWFHNVTPAPKQDGAATS